MAPAGTIVSELRSSRFAPLDARIPMLFARAKPTLLPASITRTPARARAAAALPSSDALSTTMISCEARGGEAAIDWRHCSRSARALKLTMMIDTFISRQKALPRCQKHYGVVELVPPAASRIASVSLAARGQL